MQDEFHQIGSQHAWSDQDLLSEADVARHWQKSVRTLQRWRAEGYGPVWIALGGTVRYRWCDVVAFEDRMRLPRARA